MDHGAGVWWCHNRLGILILSLRTKERRYLETTTTTQQRQERRPLSLVPWRPQNPLLLPLANHKKKGQPDRSSELEGEGLLRGLDGINIRLASTLRMND